MTGGFARRIAAATVVVLLCAGARGVAQTAPEYQVKAVFLFNFAQFVAWPDSAFAAPDAPLCIGVLGRDPFGPWLDQTVTGESAGGRPLVVRRFAQAAEVDCHIVFLGEDAARDRRALDLLASRGVLTVGDGEDFARRGGIIALVREQGRIRLQINLEVAEGAGLTLSSKLLRPARIVTTGRS